MSDFSMYNWRMVALKHGNLPSNSKFILLYLSTYMNAHGDSCFPSIVRIMGDTGLAKATVVKHLKILRETGWIVSKSIGNGKAWAHNQYYPQIPDKAVQLLNHQAQGGSIDDTRRFNRVDKAVQPVNPIYPVSNQITKRKGDKTQKSKPLSKKEAQDHVRALRAETNRRQPR